MNADDQRTSVPQRTNLHRWSLKVSGDNNVDLLSYVIKVDSILDAAQLGREIALLVAACDESEGGYAQITLRGWQVEVTMSAPGGAWAASAQEQLAAAIDRLGGR